MFTFKELMAAPIEQDENIDPDGYLQYRAQKRRRGVVGGTIGGPVGEAVEQKAVCGCGPECEHCGGKHPMSDIGEECECCGNKIKAPTNEETVTEVLSTQTRLAKSRQMKRYKTRVAIGRKKALQRTANKAVIDNRSMKQARAKMFKKLSKGKSRDELSPQRRAEIEKRLDKMKPRIQRMAIKLRPHTRELEKQRKRAK